MKKTIIALVLLSLSFSSFAGNSQRLQKRILTSYVGGAALIAGTVIAAQGELAASLILTTAAAYIMEYALDKQAVVMMAKDELANYYATGEMGHLISQSVELIQATDESLSQDEAIDFIASHI